MSITPNPLVFFGVDQFAAWLDRRTGRGDDTLSVLPEEAAGLRDHAMIVGYLRFGSVVGKELKSQDLPVVVIERDRRCVEALRQRGVPAIYGDATTPGMLEAANAD
jgi:monovalent cation:H+ antiporter-2, CPA2 family